MFQVDKDWENVDNEVPTNGADSCQQCANVWDVKRANKWEQINANCQAELDFPRGFLSLKEQPQE